VVARGRAGLLLLLGNFPSSLQVDPPLVRRPAFPSCASCWGAALYGDVLTPLPLFKRELDPLSRRHTLLVEFDGEGSTRGNRGGRGA